MAKETDPKKKSGPGRRHRIRNQRHQSAQRALEFQKAAIQQSKLFRHFPEPGQSRQSTQRRHYV